MRFSIFKIRVLHVLALKRLKRLHIEAIIFACIHDLFFEFAIDSVVAKKKKKEKRKRSRNEQSSWGMGKR